MIDISTVPPPPLPTDVAYRWSHCDPKVPTSLRTRHYRHFTGVYPPPEKREFEIEIEEKEIIHIAPEDVELIDASFRAIESFAAILQDSLPQSVQADEKSSSSFPLPDPRGPEHLSSLKWVGWRLFSFLYEPVSRRQRPACLREYFYPFVEDNPEDAAAWLGGLYKACKGLDADAILNRSKVSPYTEGIAHLYGPPVKSNLEWVRKNAPVPVQVKETTFQAILLLFGIASIVTIPTTTVYRYYHGTAAVEDLEPSMHRVLGLARKLTKAHSALLSYRLGSLTEIHGHLLSYQRGSQVTSEFRRYIADLARKRNDAGCKLYAQALRKPLRLHFDSVDMKGKGEFKFELPSTEKRDTRSKICLNFTRRTELEFPIENQEIFWALPHAWGYLRTAANLVNQAGFILIITAANNRWGGKHPPHRTHQNGICFDLDIAIPRVPGELNGKYDKVPNLAKLRKSKSKKGAFNSLDGTRFDLIPANSRSVAPRTLTKVERLALWVVLQALQLANIEDVIFSDIENMVAAIEHLAGRINAFWNGPMLYAYGRNRPPPGTGPRQLLDPLAHYNHLHVETPPSAPKASYLGLRHASFENLFEWALERDKDKSFHRLFGQEIGAPASTREKEYWKYWMSRSENQNPSLLPVWDPSVPTPEVD